MRRYRMKGLEKWKTIIEKSIKKKMFSAKVHDFLYYVIFIYTEKRLPKKTYFAQENLTRSFYIV